MILTLDEAIYALETLEEKIDSALEDEIAETIKDAIQEDVLSNVYDYAAQPFFEEHRRGEGGGGIGDKSVMEARVHDNELTIEDNADLQNLFGGSWSAQVAAIVQLGSQKFNQRHPRPFMDDGLKTAISTGAVDDALAAGLKRQGLDVD